MESGDPGRGGGPRASEQAAPVRIEERGRGGGGRERDQNRALTFPPGAKYSISLPGRAHKEHREQYRERDGRGNMPYVCVCVCVFDRVCVDMHK